MKLELQKYLEITTIHGLIYFSKKFHVVERIFWAITLIISTIFTMSLIVQLGIKFNNSPIVAYLSDEPVPISEIDFPAVTICPEIIPHLAESSDSKRNNRFYFFKRHTFTAVPYGKNESDAETVDEIKFGFDYAKILDKIANGEINSTDLGLKILKRLQIIDIVTNRRVFQKLNISVPTDDFLDVFNQLGKQFVSPSYGQDSIKFTWIVDAKSYISEVLTPFGLCMSFNLAFPHDMLNLNSTSDDFHYDYSYSKNYYADSSFRGKESEKPPLPDLPRKIGTSQTGLNIRVYILKKLMKNVFYNDFDGLIIIVHNPYELPSRNSRVLYAANDAMMDLRFQSQRHSIEQSVAAYKPEDRNCYLSSERSLKFFKIYTKSNCIQECLTEFVLNKCGCIEYFMIRSPEMRICSANERNCYDAAREDFEAQVESCKCLTQCNYVKYEYEILNNYYSDSSIFGDEVMRLHLDFRFKENSINELIRKQQFNEIDFFSYFGGLLGLFAGFSVLSFFELIYWFLLRIMTDKCKLNSTRVYPLEENSRNNGIRENIVKHFQKFFKESSIHGFGHVIRSGWVDRFLWIFFIISSLIGCFFMIRLAREKVPDSRVVAYDDDLKFYKNIQFPAITFAIDTSGVGYIAYSVNVTKEEIASKSRGRMLFNVYKLCYIQNLEIYNSDLMGLYHEYYDFMKRTLNLKWFDNQFSDVNNKLLPVFAETRTARGLGFTFNMIDAEDLFNVENIDKSFLYKKHLTMKNDRNLTKVYGNLTFSRDSSLVLSMSIKKFTNAFTLCHPVSLLIHSTDLHPHFMRRQDFLTLQYSQTANIQVSPKIIKTDPGLKSLNPMTRECFFDGEKELKFFKKYSQQNCIIECFANLTFDVCGCFDLDQPYKYTNGSCDIGGRNTECLITRKTEFYSMRNFSPEKNCSCLPTCDSVSYYVLPSYEEDAEPGEIRINIRIDAENAVLFRRYQQFTLSDVVSYVGGLLGLFAGISMLSFFEILYFMVIRVVVNVWRGFRGRELRD